MLLTLSMLARLASTYDVGLLGLPLVFYLEIFSEGVLSPRGLDVLLAIDTVFESLSLLESA